MLSQLNRNSRSYAEKHLKILKGFLTWELEITYMIEFGNTDLPYKNVYPNEAQLKALVRTEVIKLQRIRYKTTSVGNLAGLQMEFANLSGTSF